MRVCVCVCVCVCVRAYVCQGCKSHKISKFPDFSLTYLHFSLTNDTYKKIRHVHIIMNIYLNNHSVHACIVSYSKFL